LTVAKLDGKSRHLKQERQRVVPDVQEESPFSKLPKNVPIDWFDPTYFNSLPVIIRAQYRGAVVALPELWESIAWRQLDDDEFMERHGNRILAQYQIPTEEEIEAMTRAMEEDDWDEPDGNGDNEEDE
jgi:hypothetical protein